MNQLKADLERARSRAPEPDLTMERLHRRRRHKGRVNKVGVITLTLAMFLGLGGLIWNLGLGNHTTAQLPGHPGQSRKMLQFRPVLAIAPAVSGASPSPALTCSARSCTVADLDTTTNVVLQGRGDSSEFIYTLGRSFADGTNVGFATLKSPSGSMDNWIIDIQLDDTGRAALKAATVDAAGAPSPRDQIAVVWNGAVISSPAVMARITDGIIEIALPDQLEAHDLFGALNASPIPSTTPSPGPSGEDIGLAVPWCGLNKLGGVDLLGNGAKGTAWTGYPIGRHGGCPGNPNWRVAVDVTGDGRADAFSRPIKWCFSVGCAPLGASDLDADGDKELVIHTYFTLIDHVYFSVRRLSRGGFSVDPIVVASPGHPAAGIKPGAPLVTSAAGDAGQDGWVRCEGYPSSPILVWASRSVVLDSGPVHWHETKLQLRQVGSRLPMFYVVASRDFTLPLVSQDSGLILSTKPACGLDFNIWVPPN